MKIGIFKRYSDIHIPFDEDRDFQMIVPWRFWNFHLPMDVSCGEHSIRSSNRLHEKIREYGYIALQTIPS